MKKRDIRCSDTREPGGIFAVFTLPGGGELGNAQLRQARPPVMV